MPLCPARAWSGTLVLLLLFLAGCGSTGASGAPTPGAPTPGARAAGVDRGPARAHVVADRPAVRALRILRGWDRRRAAAYASGEPHPLRRLYAPGSRAGAKDVRVLRAYAERGLVVEALASQVLEVRLLAASPSLVRLRVVERLAGGTVAAAQGHARTALPMGQPRPRVVTLVDDGRGWVVQAVRRG